MSEPNNKSYLIRNKEDIEKVISYSPEVPKKQLWVSNRSFFSRELEKLFGDGAVSIILTSSPNFKPSRRNGQRILKSRPKYIIAMKSRLKIKVISAIPH